MPKLQGEDAQGTGIRRQIAGWASRLGDFGAARATTSAAALELTQLGKIILNGDIIAPQ